MYPLPAFNIHPDFLETIEEFKSDARLYDREIVHLDTLRIVRWGDPKTESKATTVGLCKTFRNYRGNLLYAEIIIDNSFKRIMSTYRFKALMYHELGHCTLSMKHTKLYPRTIMSPSLARESFYETNWEKLVRHFFTGHSD